MFLNNWIILNEYPVNWQKSFQTAASPVMEGIINFHHDLFFFLVIILTVVIYFLARCITTYNSSANKAPIIITHAPVLEIIWTIIPALILVVIAIPSFSLLYSIDEIVEPLLTVKIIGHQWYWTYELPNAIINFFEADPNFIDMGNIEEMLTIMHMRDCLIEDMDNKEYSFSYDSYMLADSDVKYLRDRLFAVDNKLYLPIEINIRLLITAADVLHSWAVPALGVKMDACPGRLNQTSTFIKRPGNFFGQCSEICGINHGFMPIHVAAIDIFKIFNHAERWKFEDQVEMMVNIFCYYMMKKFE